MKRRDDDGTTWGPNGCAPEAGVALWLTLVEMLGHLPAMIRYVRTGKEPR